MPKIPTPDKLRIRRLRKRGVKWLKEDTLRGGPPQRTEAARRESPTEITRQVIQKLRQVPAGWGVIALDLWRTADDLEYLLDLREECRKVGDIPHVHKITERLEYLEFEACRQFNDLPNVKKVLDAQAEQQTSIREVETGVTVGKRKRQQSEISPNEVEWGKRIVREIERIYDVVKSIPFCDEDGARKRMQEALDLVAKARDSFPIIGKSPEAYLKDVKLYTFRGSNRRRNFRTRMVKQASKKVQVSCSSTALLEAVKHGKEKTGRATWD